MLRNRTTHSANTIVSQKPTWKRSNGSSTVAFVSLSTTVHDALHDKVHVLNDTARFIWAACDGRHTLEEIELELKLAFDIPPDADVRDDVARTVRGLQRRNLLKATDH